MKGFLKFTKKKKKDFAYDLVLYFSWCTEFYVPIIHFSSSAKGPQALMRPQLFCIPCWVPHKLQMHLSAKTM